MSRASIREPETPRPTVVHTNTGGQPISWSGVTNDWLARPPHSTPPSPTELLRVSGDLAQPLIRRRVARACVGLGAPDHRVDVLVARASRVQERVDHRLGAFTLGGADAVGPHAEFERVLEVLVPAQDVGVAFERLPVVR